MTKNQTYIFPQFFTPALKGEIEENWAPLPESRSGGL